MPWYWPFSTPPRLDWLQVEISTLCNAACLYCPRTVYASRWRNSLMPLALFNRLIPVFKKTRLVYLQGWGEPLTHPDFLTMVQTAKGCGCQVGTTTNGMLLTEDLCRRLIETKLDVIAFSLAGIDEDNDRIRWGTSLQQVLLAIAMLNRIKHQQGSDTPAIHIAYLLLRSHLSDTSRLPHFLTPLGVAQVVVSTLDVVADQSLIDEAIVPTNGEEYTLFRQHLDGMIATGRDLNLPIHAWLAAPAPGQEGHGRTGIASHPYPDHAGNDCTEHVLHAAVVAADGGVSPCVYTNLRLNGEASHWVDGRKTILTSMVMGNIARQSFAAIWRSRRYRAFRKAHRIGDPLFPCRDCIRRRMHESEKSDSLVPVEIP